MGGARPAGSFEQIPPAEEVQSGPGLRVGEGQEVNGIILPVNSIILANSGIKFCIVEHPLQAVQRICF